MWQQMKTTVARRHSSSRAVSEERSALKPDAHEGSTQSVIKLQQRVGNRVVSRLVESRAIARHGAPEDEPLQALHDPSLQRHGTPEDEPLEALHDRSSAGNVLRVVDQKTGAVQRLVIQRADTGIAKGKALGKYIQSISKLKPKWKGLDANGRAAELGKAANARLKDADVQPCAINVKAFSGGTNGQFDFTTWTIDINQKLVSKDEVSDAELSDVADTMYHEARHAEQWFRIARWLAGTKKKTAAEIAASMAIPEAVAKKAAAKGLKESSKTARKFMGKAAIAEEAKMLTEAEAWHKNIYGSGGSERNATLDNLDPTGTAYQTAKKDYDDNYVTALKTNQDAEKKYLDTNEAWEKKQVDWDKALQAYRDAVGNGGGLSELMVTKALEIQVAILEAAKDKAFEEWEKAFEVVDRLEKTLDQATKDAIAAHAKYKALVEEADAWALGDRVKKAYAEKVAAK